MRSEEFLLRLELSGEWVEKKPVQTWFWQKMKEWHLNMTFNFFLLETGLKICIWFSRERAAIEGLLKSNDKNIRRQLNLRNAIWQ